MAFFLFPRFLALLFGLVFRACSAAQAERDAGEDVGPLSLRPCELARRRGA